MSNTAATSRRCETGTSPQTSATIFPGPQPIGRDYQRVAQVPGLSGGAVETTGGTLCPELHDVLANDEHAGALFTSRAERAGRRLDDRAVQVTQIRDRKITEIWLHPSDAHAGDEVWP